MDKILIFFLTLSVAFATFLFFINYCDQTDVCERYESYGYVVEYPVFNPLEAHVGQCRIYLEDGSMVLASDFVLSDYRKPLMRLGGIENES